MHRPCLRARSSFNMEAYNDFARRQPNPDTYYARFTEGGKPYIKELVDELVRTGQLFTSSSYVSRTYYGFAGQKKCIVPIVRTNRNLERQGGRSE